MRILVKHDTTPPPQQNDFKPIVTDFGNDQFPIRSSDRREKLKFNPLDSYSFEAVISFQSQYGKPIKKNTKTFLHQSAMLNHNGITYNDDPVVKRISHHENDIVLI